MAEYKVKVDESGVEWCNLQGFLHRENGPAVERADGSKEWWYEGIQYSEFDYLNLIKCEKGEALLESSCDIFFQDESGNVRLPSEQEMNQLRGLPTKTYVERKKDDSGFETFVVKLSPEDKKRITIDISNSEFK